MRRAFAGAGILALCACAGIGRSAWVSVRHTAATAKLSPRPAECRVEFFRTKVPDRIYDEIARFHLSGAATAAVAEEAMRTRACSLGADAVVLTQDFVELGPWPWGNGAMTGTAVSYRELRDRHRLAYALHAAERRASLKRAIAAAHPSAKPGYVGARARYDEVERMEPDSLGIPLGEIAAGDVVWVAPEATSGYRRTDRGGFVDEVALEMDLPEPPPSRSRKRKPLPSRERGEI